MPLASLSSDLLIEAANVVFLVLDPQARIRRLNSEGLTTLGYRSTAELEGRDWFDTAVPAVRRDQLRSLYLAAMAGECDLPRHDRGEVVTAAGEIRQIEWRNSLLRDENGQVTGLLRSGIDVTERCTIEDEFRRVELRQRYLLDLEGHLRDAVSARAAVDAACAALGRQLGAIFVGVGELQPDDEHTVVESEWRKTAAVPSTLGRHHQPTTGRNRFAAMLRGEVVVVRDVLDDPRTADAVARQAYAVFGARASLDIPLVRAGKVRALMFVADEEPRDWLPDEIALAQETLDRAWHAAERARAEAALAANEGKLRAILDALPIGVVLGEAPTGRISFASRATEAIFRHPPLASPDMDAYRDWEGYHADGRRVEGHEYPLARVLQTGAPAEGDYRYRRGDGSMSWVRLTGAPIRDANDQLIAGVVGVIDIDREVQLLEHQRVLVAELSHRVKNVLAVVQGIALQTIRRAGSLEAFGPTFEGRLQALATAHSLLLMNDWSTVTLPELVGALLAPFGSRADAVRATGAAIELNARQGIALSLILHELATNSTKYGALSTPGAALQIDWRLHEDLSGIRLRWRETGLDAPPVFATEGFGTRLIRRSVATDLRGTAVCETGTSALVWTFDFPRAATENDTAVGDGGRVSE